MITFIQFFFWKNNKYNFLKSLISQLIFAMSTVPIHTLFLVRVYRKMTVATQRNVLLVSCLARIAPTAINMTSATSCENAKSHFIQTIKSVITAMICVCRTIRCSAGISLWHVLIFFTEADKKKRCL